MGAPSLDWWKRAHEEQLRLCTELEHIADSLPASINRQKCIYAAKTIGPLIKATHSYEEDVLFPAVESQKANSPDVLKTLSRLRFEHFEDECFAEELTERLLLLGAGDKDVNMEATGYMLRGFFEALKRHVAFEREHLVPVMEGLLGKKTG
ncbi:hemerythrin domain-containing protein [Rhizobium alvei]|uniref:Hemerythrin domain-containing protein n=1 Tax=Rhizobium alvei TaxID=1132659 RepID=A0ABT8YHY8_9HYPH|nr:hemerythrin domain-containing protein [Rhizobium alvei]MDO6963273.1 hemerythrin domain-containing protein [Rhizobium alvei]